LVDALDSKSSSARSAGSIPARGTNSTGDFPCRLAAQPAVQDTAGSAAENWRHPEQPQLRQRPTADKERGPRAARGIYRRIGDGNADQMDQRQRQPDGNRRKSDRGLAMG